MKNWILAGLVLVVAVAGLQLLVGQRGVRDVYCLQAKKVALQEQKADLIEQKAEYEERIRRLRSDPAAVEREIREQLKFVRADETVFVVQPAP